MPLRIEGYTSFPSEALASCDHQLALIEDLLCPDDGRGGFTLSERGAAGLAEMLRGVRDALGEAEAAIGRLFAELREATSPKAAPTLSEGTRAMLQALFDAAGADAGTAAEGGAPASAPTPRLTERRKLASGRRAA